MQVTYILFDHFVGVQGKAAYPSLHPSRQRVGWNNLDISSRLKKWMDFLFWGLLRRKPIESWQLVKLPSLWEF